MQGICGMKYTGASSISIPERLDRLRKMEKAWRTLSWTDTFETTARVRWPLPPGSSFPYALEGNILAIISAPDGLLDPGSVIVHRLPSKLRGISHKTWMWNCPARASRIAIDPLRDLIVILTIEGGSSKCVPFYAL
jgi:hypothetical protein